MKKAPVCAAVLAIWLLDGSARAADTQAPTITVTNNPLFKECTGPTTDVFISPRVTDNVDALPTVQFRNLSTNATWQDPAAYPLSSTLVEISATDSAGNTATSNVLVKVQDTRPPQINLGVDTQVVDCTSPAGATVTLSAPVSDRCDPNPIVTSDAPAFLPIGTTVVTFTAVDAAGNQSQDTVQVVVRDRTPPEVDAGPDFVVFQGGGCQGDAALTTVVLPRPVVRDACSLPEAFLYRVSVDGAPPTPERTVCLAAGPHTIVWTVTDANGWMAQDTVTLTVAGGFQLTATANGPSGYRNTEAAVTATVGGPVTQPVHWTLQADRPPSTTNVNPGTGELYAVYRQEGEYCSLYLTVSDATGKTGAATPLCFGIDLHAPTAVYPFIPTQWPSPTNPAEMVPVNPGDPNTWPMLFSSVNLPLEIQAQDVMGSVRSGIQTVRVTLDPDWAPKLLMEKSACTSTPEGRLVPCPERFFAVGCDQPVEVCDATTKRMDLAKLGAGEHVLRVETVDQAGNVTTTTLPFKMGTLGDALTMHTAWATSLRNASATPMDALTDLDEAVRRLTTAKAMYPHSLGEAFLQARWAYDALSAAENKGAQTGVLMDQLALAVAGEARRLLESTADLGLLDWKPLREWPDTVGNRSQERYQGRTFLTTRAGAPTDFIVKVADTQRLAEHYLNLADGYVRQHRGREAIDAATDANNALVMLFTDHALAQVFDRGAFQVTDPQTNDSAVEAFYRGSRPARFGDFVALTLREQISRVAFQASVSPDLAIPAEARATLEEVHALMQEFSDAVGKVKLNGDRLVELGFGNKAILQQVYLKALVALEKLQSIQQSSVYTHQWLTAIALTVAFVGNFTLYEGPTALWQQAIGGALMPPEGQLAPLCDALGGGLCDTNGQTSECRFHRIWSALVDGRIRGNVQSAVELYKDSKCLMVDIYNRYYAGRFFVELDTPIDPSTYNCGLLPHYVLADECTCFGQTEGNGALDAECNGLDEDCDAQADEDYVPTTCGAGLCANRSACINGHVVECMPLEPPFTVDVTCNNVDDDCDGLTDEDYIGTGCGVGGCASLSSCVDGAELQCQPRPPEIERCDGVDNNCNGAVDEGLDQDRDGFGCIPGTPGCQRTQDTINVDGCRNIDCDDLNPAINPDATEICDYLDNDCDGLTDEGMTNECGHCGAWCNTTTLGELGGGFPFGPTPSNSEHVTKLPSGAVTIPTEQDNLTHAWVAGTYAGTVSKVDTLTGKETARYCSALQRKVSASDPRTTVSNLCAPCSGCNTPSRTAVDLHGNVFVANRGLDQGNQGSYTKIAAHERDCIDVNNNGRIDTSRDYNGDGIIDVNDPQEWLGEADECVLWTTKANEWEGTRPSGAPTGEGFWLPRALAIDKNGNVWVGAFNEKGFFEVNPATGKVKRWVSIGFSPYGAVMDTRGILWAIEDAGSSNHRLAGFNTNSTAVDVGLSHWDPGQVVQAPLQPWGDKGGYGIAIDGKQRVWVASYPADDWAAARYDPATKEWSKAAVASDHPTSSGEGRGVTVDRNNRVWVAQYGGWTGGRLTAYNADGLDILFNLYTGTKGRYPIGVGIGARGRVWTANHDGRNLTVFDPETGALSAYPTTGNLGKLYTYSDFTGNLLNTFIAPHGSYREVLEGCADHQPVDNWLRLRWTGTTPGNSHVRFRLRASTMESALATAAWCPSTGAWEVPSGQTIDLSAMQNLPDVQATPSVTNIRWVEVEAQLEADGDGNAPELWSYTLVRNCTEL